jgi:hypothetical protein
MSLHSPRPGVRTVFLDLRCTLPLGSFSDVGATHDDTRRPRRKAIERPHLSFVESHSTS